MLLKFLWLGLFSAISIYFYNVFIALDLNKRVYNHRPGPCKHLKNIEYGSEDVVLVEEHGLAFISSGVWHMKDRAPGSQGKIFLYDLNSPELDPIDLPIRGLKDREGFYPHGMSHWLIGDKIRLFVIAHTRPDFRHLVQIFDFDPKKRELVHVKTVTDAKFVRPNDILALSEDKFVLTNSGTAQVPLLDALEMFSFYKGGSLTYYDGQKGHFIAEGLFSPNGIAMDRDRRHLIVSLALDRSVVVYKISSDYRTLTEVSKTDFFTVLDNLYVDKDNVIWTGAHPVAYRLIGHFDDEENPAKNAPAQVLRIKFSPDWKTAEVHELLADDGQFLTASSAAAFYKGKLVIGTAYRRAAVCDVLYQSFD